MCGGAKRHDRPPANKSGDDPLRRWADAIAERRGRHIAVVALARRLSGVLWAMWRDGTLYDAQSAAAASAKGLRLQAQSVEQQAHAILLLVVGGA